MKTSAVAFMFGILVAGNAAFADAKSWWASNDKSYVDEMLIANGGSDHVFFTCHDSKLMGLDGAVNQSLECTWDKSAWYRDFNIVTEAQQAGGLIQRTTESVYTRSNYYVGGHVRSRKTVSVIKRTDLADGYQEQEISAQQDGAPAPQLLTSTYTYENDGSVRLEEKDENGQVMHVSVYHPR